MKFRLKWFQAKLKMNFLGLLILIIHDSGMIRLRRQRNFILKATTYALTTELQESCGSLSIPWDLRDNVLSMSMAKGVYSYWGWIEIL